MIPLKLTFDFHELKCSILSSRYSHKYTVNTGSMFSVTILSMVLSAVEAKKATNCKY